MSAFFADTFYWIALTNKRDGAHRVFMEFTASLGPQTVIASDEVLTEFLTFCASDELRRGAAGAVNGLLTSPFVDGLALYKQPAPSA